MEPTGEPQRERHHLDYAAPTRRPAGAPLPHHVLAACNVIACVISFGFVPLTLHIHSCTEDQKWCHFQAFVFGVPMAIVVVILAALTMAITFRRGQPPRQRRQLLKVVAWLPLAVAAGVLAALFAAVAHNS